METLCKAQYALAKTTPFSSTILVGKQNTPKSTATASVSLSLNLKQSSQAVKPTSSSAFSNNLRRPNKSIKTSIPTSQSIPKTFSKPQKRNNSQNPLSSSCVQTPSSHSGSLTSKLWLTSKLSPPADSVEEKGTGSVENDGVESSDDDDQGLHSQPVFEFRQEGKIFVGNLPNWVKKNEVAEFFRQFGPVKEVILIKSHNDIERNAGFGFVIYGGPNAAMLASKAEQFDGVEFHGRVLTVKLDDGRRSKEKSEQRALWVEGYDEVEYRSQWHEDREGSRKEFRKVLETEPENWQAVVRSFEEIKKVEFI